MRSWKRLRYALKTWLFDLKFHWAARDGWLYRNLVIKSYEPSPTSVEGLLSRYSRQQKEVYLVQVGANDGMTHDPVNKLIKREGWHALLFEPQPHVYEDYLVPNYAHYPKVKPINAAIGYEDGSAALYTLSFSRDRWATGLARFDKELLSSLIEEGRLDRRLHRYGIIPPADKAEWIQQNEIAVRSFDSAMRSYAIPRIDVLMIDTEGFDHEVLRMVDFDRFKPVIVVFEDMHIPADAYDACIERLTGYGYRTHRQGPNTIAWGQEVEKLIEW